MTDIRTPSPETLRAAAASLQLAKLAAEAAAGHALTWNKSDGGGVINPERRYFIHCDTLVSVDESREHLRDWENDSNSAYLDALTQSYTPEDL